MRKLLQDRLRHACQNREPPPPDDAGHRALVNSLQETLGHALYQDAPLLALAHQEEAHKKKSRREQRGPLAARVVAQERERQRKQERERGVKEGGWRGREDEAHHDDARNDEDDDRAAPAPQPPHMVDIVAWYRERARLDASKRDDEYVQLNSYYDNTWKLARDRVARGLAVYKNLGKSRRLMPKGKVLLSSKYLYGAGVSLSTEYTANTMFVYFHVSAINAALSSHDELSFSDTKAALVTLHLFGANHGAGGWEDRLPERLDPDLVERALDRLAASSGSFSRMTDTYKLNANTGKISLSSSSRAGGGPSSLGGYALHWLLQHLTVHHSGPTDSLLFKRASSPYNSLFDRAVKRRACVNAIALLHVARHMMSPGHWSGVLRHITASVDTCPVSLPSVNFLHGCYIVLLTLSPTGTGEEDPSAGLLPRFQPAEGAAAAAAAAACNGVVGDRFLKFLDFYYDFFRESKKNPPLHSVIYWQHEFNCIMETIYNDLHTQNFAINKTVGMYKEDSNTAAYSTVNFNFLFSGGLEELDDVPSFLQTGFQGRIVEKMALALNA